MSLNTCKPHYWRGCEPQSGPVERWRLTLEQTLRWKGATGKTVLCCAKWYIKRQMVRRWRGMTQRFSGIGVASCFRNWLRGYCRGVDKHTSAVVVGCGNTKIRICVRVIPRPVRMLVRTNALHVCVGTCGGCYARYGRFTRWGGRGMEGVSSTH